MAHKCRGVILEISNIHVHPPTPPSNSSPSPVCLQHCMTMHIESHSTLHPFTLVPTCGIFNIYTYGSGRCTRPSYNFPCDKNSTQHRGCSRTPTPSTPHLELAKLLEHVHLEAISSASRGASVQKVSCKK